MKICLVSYMPRAESQIPIGLLTLAEIAREEGVRDVRVVDLPARRDEEAFVRSLLDFDVVGFSSICSTYNLTTRLCRRLKAVKPDVCAILGGPQATLTAQASLAAFRFVDVIFQGEAEHAWRTYLRQAREGVRSWGEVPGVAWRDDGTIRLNAPAPLIDDLDALPLPAFDLYDFGRDASVTPIEIGRGCPFACTFCSSSPFFKRRFRLKTAARILEEMDALFAQYGSRKFYFVQDSFSVKRSFVEEICAAIENHHRSYTWHCSARTDQISEDLLARMRDAGCRGIYLGLETGSQRMQQIIKKRLDIEQSLGMIQVAADLRLEVVTSMIIGFPEERPEDLYDTLRVFLHLKAAGHAVVQLHVLAPMPGSALSREGHVLNYDAMPSDFSDTSQVLDQEDEALIRGNPEIFSNFWYYETRWLSRRRLLFFAHFLGLASLYFPNILCLAARYERESLLDWLLRGEIPSQLLAESQSGSDLAASVTGTGELLTELFAGVTHGEALGLALRYDLAYSRTEVAAWPDLALLDLPAVLGARPGRLVVEGLEKGGPLAPYVVQRPERAVEVIRVSPDTAASLARTSAPEGGSGPDNPPPQSFEEICAACGECCLEGGGLLCGQDEWPQIRDSLAANGSRRLLARPFDGSVDLLIVDEQKEVVQAGDAPDGTDRVRRACLALELGERGWRCSIEKVKPAGCIAFPLNLVLREGGAAETPWTVSLEFDPLKSRDSCPLEKVLKRSPDLLRRFCDDVKRRQTDLRGAFALAAYNRRKLLHEGSPEDRGEPL